MALHALLQLSSGSHKLFSFIYPSHFTKNSNLLCLRCESNISSTTYSSSPSTSTGDWSVICCPGMVGGLYGCNWDTLMGTSILNDGGNFRTIALGETTCVIVYGPICLSVSFLDGQLIFRFLVLSHTWSPSLYSSAWVHVQSAKCFMSSCALHNATSASSWIFFSSSTNLSTAWTFTSLYGSNPIQGLNL